MSKWLRKSIRQCDNFKDCLRGLETFFKKFEVNYFPSDGLCGCFKNFFHFSLSKIVWSIRIVLILHKTKQVPPSSVQVPIINTVGKLASTQIPKLPITFSSTNTRRAPINLKRKSSKLEEQSNFDAPAVPVMDVNSGYCS